MKSKMKNYYVFFFKFLNEIKEENTRKYTVISICFQKKIVQTEEQAALSNTAQLVK